MDTIKVTELAEFWKGTTNGETRYYATREAGMGFDPAATKVKGHAVYDTTVAASYAVELYPTKAQAEAHKPAVPQKAPTSAVEDDYDDEDFGTALGVGPHTEAEDEDDEKASKSARKTAIKKRGR